MPKLNIIALMLTLIAITVGCAGSSSGGFSSASYLTDLGLTTNIGFRTESDRILVRKNQYIVQLIEESLDRSYLETAWKDRLPFEDEQAAGVIQAKSRIILEGRSRMRATGSATLKVKFKGENQLLYQTGNIWETGAEITPMCKEYFKNLAGELKTEFSTRVREF